MLVRFQPSALKDPCSSKWDGTKGRSPQRLQRTPAMTNSWTDNWTCPVSSAEPNTTKMPTIESIRQAIREFKEQLEDLDLGPDVWVLTHAETQELKRRFEKRDPTMEPMAVLSSLWTTYGVCIETVTTKEEAIDRVAELASNGVKAGYLKEKRAGMGEAPEDGNVQGEAEQ